MSLEYSAWGPSRRWRGGEAEVPFQPVSVPDAVARALGAADPAPPWQGSASKHFDDVFSKIFVADNGKLLTPDDARATAAWIAEWASAPEREAGEAEAARRAATRLEALAEHGWYLDWDL